jgi:ribosomal protein S18 acetylase RimI-like enzyme
MAAMNKHATAIEILEADLARPEHQQAVCEMLDAYSRDPLGNGKPLDDEVRERLVPGLRANPQTMILLAYDGARPVGIAACFLGFSTFAARPLLNIHDLAVIPDYRGRGIGRRLLCGVEEAARKLGCCKVTLEVLEANPARKLYEAIGYSSPDYQNGAGRALFLAKAL